jgi:hypothetical protein
VIGLPVPRGCLITDGAMGATGRRRRLNLRPYRAARWCGSAVGNRMPRTGADVPLTGCYHRCPFGGRASRGWPDSRWFRSWGADQHDQ